MDLSDGLKLAVEIAGQTDELKPVVKIVLGALRKLAPEITEVVNDLGKYIIDSKAMAVNRLVEEHGFTRKEAIMMTMRIEHQALQALKKK